MKLVWLLIGAAALGVFLGGCNSGVITDQDQQAKAKAMDDIAKKDPRYAEKSKHGRY